MKSFSSFLNVFSGILVALALGLACTVNFVEVNFDAYIFYSILITILILGALGVNPTSHRIIVVFVFTVFDMIKIYKDNSFESVSFKHSYNNDERWDILRDCRYLEYDSII